MKYKMQRWKIKCKDAQPTKEIKLIKLIKIYWFILFLKYIYEFKRICAGEVQNSRSREHGCNLQI